MHTTSYRNIFNFILITLCIFVANFREHSYEFVIPLLDVIINVFYPVLKVCAVAQFSFMYLYPPPDDSGTNDRNTSYINNNNRTYSVRCCVCVDWSAIEKCLATVLRLR